MRVHGLLLFCSQSLSTNCSSSSRALGSWAALEIGLAREDLFQVNNSMDGSTENNFLKIVLKVVVTSVSCSAGTPDWILGSLILM